METSRKKRPAGLPAVPFRNPRASLVKLPEMDLKSLFSLSFMLLKIERCHP
jgi:hypothetical protein